MLSLREIGWRRERDSNPCGREPKRFSRPPRYDHFDIPPYMKLLSQKSSDIHFFRNIFRNAIFGSSRSARKVSVYKAFLRFCDRYARKFSRPPRYDRFDNPPRLFQSVELKIRPRKKERTTGENKQKYSVVKVQKSLINQGFSGINVPITSTNFKTASL